MKTGRKQSTARFPLTGVCVANSRPAGHKVATECWRPGAESRPCVRPFAKSDVKRRDCFWPVPSHSTFVKASPNRLKLAMGFSCPPLHLAARTTPKEPPRKHLAEKQILCEPGTPGGVQLSSKLHAAKFIGVPIPEPSMQKPQAQGTRQPCTVFSPPHRFALPGEPM